MISFICAFFTSFFITFLVIYNRYSHQKYTGDFGSYGIQKFHLNTIPRIGGLGVGLAVILAMLIASEKRHANLIEWTLPLLVMTPLAIGLVEDTTKKLGAKTRLALITMCALLTALFLNLHISTVSIWGLDTLLLIPAISTAVAVLAIVGLTNAYNIIDGVNGLASMVGLLTSLSLAYLGYSLDDPVIMQLSFSLTGALLGFFILNYPRGLIFLGDGGAYLIGFWIAALSIWTCANHPEVSPWFALLISAYPITETVFTIFRRGFYSKKNILVADRLHLHSLIYRRALHASNLKMKLNLY